MRRRRRRGRRLAGTERENGENGKRNAAHDLRVPAPQRREKRRLCPLLILRRWIRMLPVGFALQSA